MTVLLLHPSDFLLAAGAGDWIKVIIFLAFFIGPVIYRAISSLGKQPGKPAAPPQPAQGGPQQAQDLDDFLRRATERRDPPQPMQGEVEVVQYQGVDEEPVVAMEIESEGRLGSHVREHVAQHMAEGRVTEHASHLADRIAQVDEQDEQRLHKKFDHALGQLGSSASHPDIIEVAEGTDAEVWTQHLHEQHPEANIAAEIAGMLRDSTDVRKAIVLSEILSPRGDSL